MGERGAEKDDSMMNRFWFEIEIGRVSGQQARHHLLRLRIYLHDNAYVSQGRHQMRGGSLMDVFR